MTDKPNPPSGNGYVRMMWIVLAVFVVLGVFGNAVVRAIAVLGAAYAIWNLVMLVPGKVSKALEGRSRLVFTVAAAALFPLILSLYFLQGASGIDLWASIRYFAGWYALIPLAIIAFISQAVGRSIIDKDHPVTGLLVVAYLLFVIMSLGYHGIDLGRDEDGYSTSDPIDPARLKAQQRAGYHFVVYWLYICVSYFGIAIGMARRRAEWRKLDAAVARSKEVK
jgi:hypothetical protein